MSSTSKLIIVHLAICLTISQSALAQRTKQSDPYDSFETRSRQTYEVIKAAPEPAKSIAHMTPASGELMAEFEGFGVKSSSELAGSLTNNLISNPPTSMHADSSGFRDSAKLSYGISKVYYIGAEVDYQSISGTVDAIATSVSQATTTKIETTGIKEPSLFIGGQGLWGKTRLITELIGRLPVGDNEITDVDTKRTSNFYDGGLSVTPKVLVISDIQNLRLSAGTSYEIAGDRKIKKTVNAVETKQTATNGNTLSVMTGLEIPSLMNLGFQAIYEKIEDTKTANDGTINSVSNTSPASVQVSTFMGVPLNQKSFLIPRLSYRTIVENSFKYSYSNGSSETYQVDKSAEWSFGVGAQIRF